MCFVLTAVLYLAFATPAWAALPSSSAGVPALLEHVVGEFQKARSPAEWIEKAPGLSALEREALREDPNFRKGKMPRFELETPGANRATLTVNDERFDLSYLTKGKLLYEGIPVPVSRKDTVFDLTVRLAEASKKKNARATTWKNLSWFIAEARADESLRRGCATKDLFTWYDVANSPFMFSKLIWVPSAVSAVLRWGGNQFRSCDTQIRELQEILRKDKIALKSLNCGSNQWGNDRKMEFWQAEKGADGKQRTRTFSLDYTNAFAMEMPVGEGERSDGKGAAEERAPDKKMYVFRPDSLREVRILRDKGEDFYGACDVLNEQSKGQEFVAFRNELSDIEKYRKVFFYVGENNTCTACPLVETRIVSPRPPGYLKAAVAPPPMPADKVPSGSAL